MNTSWRRAAILCMGGVARLEMLMGVGIVLLILTRTNRFDLLLSICFVIEDHVTTGAPNMCTNGCKGHVRRKQLQTALARLSTGYQDGYIPSSDSTAPGTLLASKHPPARRGWGIQSVRQHRRVSSSLATFDWRSTGCYCFHWHRSLTCKVNIEVSEQLNTVRTLRALRQVVGDHRKASV